LHFQFGLFVKTADYFIVFVNVTRYKHADEKVKLLLIFNWKNSFKDFWQEVLIETEDTKETRYLYHREYVCLITIYKNQTHRHVLVKKNFGKDIENNNKFQEYHLKD